MTIAKQNKIIPVCVSLVMHLLAAAILVSGLSNYSNVTSDFNKKLNLVWVSLETKSVPSPPPAVQKNERQPKSAAGNGYSDGTETAALAQNTEPEGKLEKEPPEISLYGRGPAAPERKIMTPAAVSEKNAHPAGGSMASASGAPAVFSSAYPLYKENTPPGYPEIARLRGYEGVVLISVEILPDGRVGAARISKSSGYAILDQTALEAVKPWKFEPAKKSGKPHKMWVELPIKFVLNDERQQS